MSLFGALIKTTVNIATLPIDIIKDVVTLGGVITEQDKPYTLQKLDTIKEDIEDE